MFIADVDLAQNDKDVDQGGLGLDELFNRPSLDDATVVMNLTVG